VTELHFRVFRATGLVPADALNNSLRCSIPTQTPEIPDAPEGEWYCENSVCVVRECAIRCSANGIPLPKMRCPGCAQPLKFHHWIGREWRVAVG
jgi:hypothetical protein